MVVNFSNENLGTEEQDTENEENKKNIIDKVNNYLLTLSKVPLKEQLFFVRHLSLMLKSGISLSIGLTTLAKQTENKFFQIVLNDLGETVEKGSTFADAMRKYPKVFSEMTISMVDAGEISGKLEEVLQELFIQMKQSHALITKVKGALTYPAVIIIAMVGIGTFMMVAIVPKITGMFDELDAELPLPTKVVMAVSDLLLNNGLLAIIGVIIMVIAFIQIWKTEKGKYAIQAGMLRLPIFGPIIKKMNLARFARNISSLLKTDIMIIKTFQITAQVLGNLHYRRALNAMAEKIKKGGKLHDVINEYPHLFTPIVTQMVAIGEETGELDNILVELAEFYEEEINQIMENLPSIIEPVLILFLGLGVGGMAVAIIMPMYSIGSAI